MHRCEECGTVCICSGDFAHFMSEAPNPNCIHCASKCEHGISFDVPCAQCDALIHAAEDQIDAAGDAGPFPIHSRNGGW